MIWRSLSLWPLLCCAGIALAQTPAPAPAGRSGPSLGIELNKLEDVPGACRAYFVATSRLAEPLGEIGLDTFVFDPTGAIGQRVSLTFPDLRPGRTKVVPFDLAGGGCKAIGRLLVNDVLACSGPSGAPIRGCADFLTTTSRTPASFDY